MKDRHPTRLPVFVSGVGSGFDVRELHEVHARLSKIEVKVPPTATLPQAHERRLAQWVRPTLVGEIQFTGWT